MTSKAIQAALFIFLSVLGALYLLHSAQFLDAGAYQKRQNAIIGPFDDQHSYTQTFVAATPYLSAIELSFVTTGYSEASEYHVFLNLRDATGREIARIQRPVPHHPQESEVRFSFFPQKGSQNESYRLDLGTDAPARLVFLTGSEYDSYPEGELLLNNDFTGQDLSFFTYSKPYSLAAFLQLSPGTGSRLIGIVIISLLLFLVGLMISINFLQQEDLLAFLIYSLMIGLAIPPLLLLLLSILGIHLEQNSLLMVLLGGAGLASVIRLFRRRANQEIVFPAFNSREFVALGLLALLAALTRLIEVRDLTVPSGVGAFTHQMILERIGRQGGIPLDAIYHMGFHSNVYFLHLLMGESLPETTLLFSQWLSIASGLSFYLLARRIFSNRLYALLATSLFWFAAPIPAYLLNISRFPFMQGLTLLPAAILLGWDLIRGERKNGFVTFLLLGGLLYSHYGVFIAFVIVLAGMVYFTGEGMAWNRLYKRWQPGLLLVSAPLVMLVMIKLFYVARGGELRSFLAHPGLATQEYAPAFEHTLSEVGSFLWLLGITGCILYFYRNKGLSRPAILCLAGLWASDWLQMALLGHSATRITNLIYLSCIPICLGAGYILGAWADNLRRWSVLPFVIVLVAGAYNISGIANPRNVFFTEADQHALTWIRQNSRAESTWLINSTEWDGKYEPADSGFWMGVLADRKTVFANSVREYESIQDFIRNTQADYVYIGQGYGNITPLTMYALGFSPVYQQEGIYIYALNK